MKIIYHLIVAALVLCAGCGDKKDASEGQQPPSPTTPSVADYKVLLEKRASSVDGANINIMQEVGNYEKATDEEKRELYNKVKALVKGGHYE